MKSNGPDYSPEISDAIVSFDPETLKRGPVVKSQVLKLFSELDNRVATRVVEKIPDHDGVLDPTAVDQLLVTSHCEMQRMSEEFQHGKRVGELLKPILNALREGGLKRKIRIVDIGCGTGFVVRWLTAKEYLGSDVEVIGADFNEALINEARRLAHAENLNSHSSSLTLFAWTNPSTSFSQPAYFITFAATDSPISSNSIASHKRSSILIFIAHRWRHSVRGSSTPCECANHWQNTTACFPQFALTQRSIYSKSRKQQRLNSFRRSTEPVCGDYLYRACFTRLSESVLFTGRRL